MRLTWVRGVPRAGASGNDVFPLGGWMSASLGRPDSWPEGDPPAKNPRAGSKLLWRSLLGFGDRLLTACSKDS